MFRYSLVRGKIEAPKFFNIPTIIALSIFWLAGGQLLLFALLMPDLTFKQGNQIIVVLENPMIWMFGMVLLSTQAFSNLFTIN